MLLYFLSGGDSIYTLHIQFVVSSLQKRREIGLGFGSWWVEVRNVMRIQCLIKWLGSSPWSLEDSPFFLALSLSGGRGAFCGLPSGSYKNGCQVAQFGTGGYSRWHRAADAAAKCRCVFDQWGHLPESGKCNFFHCEKTSGKCAFYEACFFWKFLTYQGLKLGGSEMVFFAFLGRNSLVFQTSKT